MAPSAGASPRRWSSFGTKGRISEEGGILLRRVSEAAALAEAGQRSADLTAHQSGSTSPDQGACPRMLDQHTLHHQLLLLT